MAGTRDTPPDPLQDGQYGEYPPSTDFAAVTSGANADGSVPELDIDQARKVAREAYESSTNWLNAGRRIKWNDSLRAFQSMFPSGSKYLSTDYRYRSRYYRPKTRTMVRKAEAQTAAAFFSNEDVISIQAQDDDDPKQQASAEINQQLVQYRLTKTIPWFQTLLGARQDCEVMGICVGKAYWKFSEEYAGTKQIPRIDESGMPQFDPETGEQQFDSYDSYKKIEDHPWVDLLAPENFRFDPGADWRDPVGTSPYVIELIPTYVADALEKIRSGEWLKVSEGSLLASTNLDDDVTRRAREQGRVPGKDHDSWKPRSFDICWVRENVLRWGGQDWQYLSLSGGGELLTLPKPLKEVYLHGVRPYVVGCTVLETHKTYPSSKAELVADLQRASNDDWNLRFDNVKLSLNPRQFVRQGAGIEIQDMRTFMPGKVVSISTKNNGALADNVMWDRPPEPGQSSYLEADRINADFQDLSGDWSMGTMAGAQNPVVPETVGGMDHMAAPSVSLNEYELRLFAETFVEKIVRQIVKLEQAYETDATILALAGQKAQLYTKYGISEITDELLNQELTTRVNVGVGSTNPATRLKNFFTGAQILGQIFGPSAAMGANFQEVSKEIFGMLGYKDGSRFFQPGFDPRVAMMQQQLKKQQGKGQGTNQSPAIAQSRVQTAQIQTRGKLQERQMQNQSDMQIAQMDLRKTMLQEQAETARTLFNARKDVVMQGRDHASQQAQAMHPALAPLVAQRG